jgi:hypothetical protein
MRPSRLLFRAGARLSMFSDARGDDR